LIPSRDTILNHKIVVLGAARSGLAAARLLSAHGGSVLVSESGSIDKMRQAADELRRAGIDAEFGGHARAFEADWWVVSPGVPLNSPVLVEAEKRGIPFVGEIELASWFCRAPIVAVTGSNGKSTVTALLGEIFKAAGKSTWVGGNIGNPFSGFAETADADGIVVLELSSFQLETVRSFRPACALFLNLTPDHIDRHGSFETYGMMKARIFENQTAADVAVYNGLDERVVRLTERAASKLSPFSIEHPTRDCAYVSSGMITLRVGGKTGSVLAIFDMKLRGEHNVANALAAALAARHMGVPAGTIAQTLRTFSGLAHRMEFVRELDGVTWVNDSKGTNVDSVWYALASYDSPIVLIAGGRDKDSDFTVLRERVQEKTRALVLIGEATDKIEKAMAGVKPVVRAETLSDAIDQARSLARPGDVVMLSPACASFDMFKNFEDRGDQFKDLVNRL
jgi:UDP-N-acetylmuramoylalanine--D-glutamate ligase